ncbi:hypothetical protein B7463_g2676, partial [Scytalidium lignicola]
MSDMSDTENSVQSEHASLTTERLITLNVGERRFITTLETITQESDFFAALFSGRWDDNVQEDGSYFIDADPELFEHILRYLRRRVLPVFYDNIKGHDHTLYLALLEEAKYFQIPRLEKWLRDKEYLKAIKIKYTAAELEGSSFSETRSADEQVEYRPTWQTRKVYICPRGISVHRGDPGACGRQCKNAQGGEGNMFEDEQILRTLVIWKQIIFDQAACMQEYDDLPSLAC